MPCSLRCAGVHRVTAGLSLLTPSVNSSTMSTTWSTRGWLPRSTSPWRWPAALAGGRTRVGKTAAAKALARALNAPLIRLQCYEGLTASEALYEWNYQRQLLAIRLAESRDEKLSDADLFTEEFLQERPILQCIRYQGPVVPVLLIDEIDRADDEFEALLFEFLGEASITIPELGTYTAERRPMVILTSNRSRELHDALRRRCLYHWIDFPGPMRAVEILRRTVPAANDGLILSATDFVGRVRGLDLDKPPGMAETIDWVSASPCSARPIWPGPTSCSPWGRLPRPPTIATP